MSQSNSVFQSGLTTWNLPEGDSARQAVAPLRGYVYQLEASLARWLVLPTGSELLLEVAEDYAEVARNPGSLEAVLKATQIKDTRESGAVTLNSADVLDAIKNYWKLKAANPDRRVQMNFLTTSPIGKERKKPLADGKGLDLWRRAARGGDCAALRAGLVARFPKGDLSTFLSECDDAALREQLLRPIIWSCGEPDVSALHADNRALVIELAHSMSIPPDFAERAADALLVRVMTVAISQDRRLRRGELIDLVHKAGTVRVPASQALGILTAVQPRQLDLEAAGLWRPVRTATSPLAARGEAISKLAAALVGTGSAWLHGPTGMGKTTLAAQLARGQGGDWHVLDLRNVSKEVAVERVNAARQHVAGASTITGLILDDLNPVYQPDLEGPLTELKAALERRDAQCLVTAYQKPGMRLSRALSLTADAVISAPSLTPPEIATLIAELGGDVAVWSTFVWTIAGVGHPQLVDVLTSSLAARGWPLEEMERWRRKGLQSEDIEAEREAARRRLLDEMDEADLRLLTRASRVMGWFDRPLGVALGALEVVVPNPAQALDRLTGRWLESMPAGQLRTSPLVAGLAAQWLDATELKALDRHIAIQILARKEGDPSIIDTAFAHALLAEEEGVLVHIARLILTAPNDARPLLAGQMSTFRMAGTAIASLLVDRPYAGIFLSLAQHRLTATVGDARAVAASAADLVDQWRALPDEDMRKNLGGLVHLSILMDQYAFGKIPNWFELILALDSIEPDDEELAFLDRSMTGPNGEATVDFLFIAHVIQVPGLKALGRLFALLNAMSAEDRRRWIGVLETGDHWLGMAIDNAWLKESEASGFEPQQAAMVLRDLGRMAIGWGETRLAARCIRSQAVILDEYVADRAAALEVLDQADEVLPNNVDLMRERAKIAWRARDYQYAFDQLTALADRLAEADPIDTAFALREAAASAGELQRWSESVALFERARQAALTGTRGNETVFSVGLAVDTVAARFESGDRIGAVRTMVPVLESLSLIDPAADLKSFYLHHIARHVVMWMLARMEGKYLVDGEPAVHVPGAASNPAPNKAILERPLADLPAGWMLMARIGLRLGLPKTEVLSWPGVTDMRSFGMLEALFQGDLIDRAIVDGDQDAFVEALGGAAAGRQLLFDLRRADPPPDPLRPTRFALPAFDPASASRILYYLRLTVLVFGAARLFQQPAGGRLTDLATAVERRLNLPLTPEWAKSGDWTPPDGLEAVFKPLARLEAGEVLDIDALYLFHLRLWEVARRLDHVDVFWPILSRRIREDWLVVIRDRTALLRTPMATVPPLRETLQSGSGEAWIGRVLLGALNAVPVRLADDFLKLLKDAATPSPDPIAPEAA